MRLRFRFNAPKPLDAELAELIETVWAAEKIWRLENRVEAAIQYGRKPAIKRISLSGSRADG